MLQADERLVFFDLETAGLKTSATIIQIAAVAVDSQLRELEFFETKIRFEPGRTGAKAIDINSFEPTVWKRLAEKPKEAAYRFSVFLRRHATVDAVSKEGKAYQLAQLAAHNAAFDGPMIQSWFRKQKLFLPASKRVFCTMQRALWLFCELQSSTPPANYRLGTLCEYFGIDHPDRKAHDALTDVRATVELYRAMIRETVEQLQAA